MIRWMVLNWGRANTWAVLFGLGVLGLAIITAPFRGSPEEIDPTAAVSPDGHVVTVHINGGPGWDGTYQVITLAGHPPTPSSGTFADDVDVVVGPDWVGQIQVTWSGTCAYGRGDMTWSAISTPIGGPYGWAEQTVDGEVSC